jgi:hypothetical protein
MRLSVTWLYRVELFDNIEKLIGICMLLSRCDQPKASSQNLLKEVRNSTKNNAVKAYGEWIYSSTILDLGTSWRWMALHGPAALPPGKEPPVPIG